ncbi:hypothetical protein MBLNU13_g02394t2 [Cladosporium sp. NU13]
MSFVSANLSAAAWLPRTWQYSNRTHTDPPQAAAMYFLTYLGAGISCLSASSGLPTSQPKQKRCDALIEYAPWHVSNIVVYNAEPTAQKGSSIEFNVRDTNPCLDFDTKCERSMPVGTGLKPEDTHRWYTCEDKRVRFLYQPGNLKLSRSYRDDCLGPPPYNGGVFYGNADTHFEISRTDNAVVWTQTAMEVPITSQT